jgi:glycosyltransferase involved in cell wall biosynthesis
MRILFFTEDLSEPFDEGIKKSALNIAMALAEKNDVMAICKFGVPSGTLPFALKRVDTNRLMINMKFISLIRKFQPDAIFYLPSSSGTFASFLRMGIIKTYAGHAKTVMINLTPKQLNKFQKKLIKYIRPDIVLSPSPTELRITESMRIASIFLPLFVDTSKFQPLQNIERKEALRKKYDIPVDKYIITHIGHINWGRNLNALIPIQNGDNQVVVVGSSSTPIDAPREKELKKHLLDCGIKIIDRYVENIEELYQLSDLYIFPVIFEGGCIGIPLSILEARACGIPVLSTEFGGLKEVPECMDQGIYYSEYCDFPQKVKSIRENINADFKISNVKKVNDKFYNVLNEAIRS